MAYKYDPTIEPNIKALIGKLTQFQENTEIFNHIHDYFLKSLRRIDSAFATTKCEIDNKVEGLAEKLVFHGFLHESQTLKTLYSKYLSTNSSDEEMKNKMAVMQFLFGMSRSPTTNLSKLSECILQKPQVVEEDIDWTAYLLEGLEPWKPNFDESDDTSDMDEDNEGSVKSVKGTATNDYLSSSLVQTDDLCDKNLLADEHYECYEKFRKNLSENVQSKWYTSTVVRDLPEGNDPEADIAIRWERYLSTVSHGLLGGTRTKLLSEYKVLREIIWQLSAPHNSVVFQWSGNHLIVKDNVTIPSLRPLVFRNLINTFLADIHMLHELRTFHRRVMSDAHAPHTYRGYSEAVQSILQPAVQRIVQLEAELIKEETTMTLISFGNQLKHVLKDAQYLHRVHRVAILDYNMKPRHVCCMHLLITLYGCLAIAYEKCQMDVILTLYLEAAYKYVRIIEEWFRHDRLMDPQREFPLAESSSTDEYGVQVHTVQETAVGTAGKKEIFFKADYTLREFNHSISDPLITLINKEVMQIGRQLRLFNLLGKLHLLHETEFSIYEEWKSRIFDVLKEYSAICGTVADAGTDREATTASDQQRAPGVINLEKKYSTECDLLENIADTTDGFLMGAFYGDFYTVALPTACASAHAHETSTYALLQDHSLGQRHLPGIQHIVSETLETIIKTTSRKCGTILKDLFLRDHHLEEHFAILGKVFLFADDVIFPFYRAIFAKIEANANWGNDIWLTHDLQDILVDAHPMAHENIHVGVRAGWAAILEDPLRTCTLIDVQYRIAWPIDIIVTERCVKMYREMFYFILKIKWALHTLNHLGYSRVEQKKRQKAPACVLMLLHRLELLRFGYTNVFAALQHYILGYVYRVCRGRFDREFEAAKDLESLIRCHEQFIGGLHRLVARVRDYQAKAFGFDRALYSVRQLRKMWLAPGDIVDQVLKKTEDSLKECHRNIFDVINVQVYD